MIDIPKKFNVDASISEENTIIQLVQRLNGRDEYIRKLKRDRKLLIENVKISTPDELQCQEGMSGIECSKISDLSVRVLYLIDTKPCGICGSTHDNITDMSDFCSAGCGKDNFRSTDGSEYDEGRDDE